MRILLILVVLGFLPGSLRAVQPADAMLAAHRDVLRLPPEERPYARYLWCSETDPRLKQACWQAASGLANSTSTRSRIVQPVLILEDGTERRWPRVTAEDWARLLLIRARTIDYGDTWGKTFDRLGDARLEPLFHVVVLKPYPAGKYSNGTSYPAGATREQYLAPWLLAPLGLPGDWFGSLVVGNTYQRAVVELSQMTGSPTPVVEVSNYVWQAAIQFDRRAGYYDFLGVKDRKTFDRLVGFDEHASLAFAYPLLEALAVSGVATQPRRVEIWQKIGGILAQTKDQVNQRGLKNRNPLLTLGLHDLDFDATEIFASLPNGFWATGLFAKDGTRQDSAPDGVGYHHGTLTNDGKIHINLSCLQCHDRVAGNGGLQPFRPYFRSLYVEPGPLALPGQKALRGLEDQYLTPIDLEADQQRYTKAVQRATGLTPDKYAAVLGEVFHLWDRPVTRTMAAQRYGVEERELVRALSAYLKAHRKIDNVNANWLLPESSAIGVDQFAESYGLGQLALRGLPTWPVEGRKYGGK